VVLEVMLEDILMDRLVMATLEAMEELVVRVVQYAEERHNLPLVDQEVLLEVILVKQQA
jgi:hypothetical protein